MASPGDGPRHLSHRLSQPHHRTVASNGPTEGMNLCIKKVKRAGHGFSSFYHYRLRVLLHSGGCNWARYTARPALIRTRCSPVR